MTARAPRIVLGISGGVAAYKAIELCRRLVDAGFFVSPIMTESATRFVGPATFAALASEPPRSSLWESPEPSPHTFLGQTADLIVVAPATARIIASYAHGLSDDLLATTLLATRAPVLIAPAMHTEMWEHPAVRANVDALQRRGTHIVPPASGHLAGGDQGVGRLADVDQILERIQSVLRASTDLAGRRILVTAGGTREPIDPVRFIGNRSSGKQGHAIALAAVERGAQVTLVTSSPLPAPPNVSRIDVETAEEMHNAVLAELANHQVLIMAAAVADFRPAERSHHKIKKHEGVPELVLVPTADTLRAVADARSAEHLIVGFAAETTDAVANGKSKLAAKRLDLIVINDVGQAGVGFEHETNSVTIVDRFGQEFTTTVQNKRTVADALLDKVVATLPKLPPLTGE